MSASPPSPILVIGVGNADRGDDAVGRVVARRVKEMAPPGVHAIEQGGDGAELMESWRGADRVIVVDAANCAAGSAGTIHRFDAAAGPLPTQGLRHSTHDFSLAEAIELSRALNQLPRHLLVFGIVGEDFNFGRNLSIQVAGATDRAAREILAEAQKLRDGPVVNPAGAARRLRPRIARGSGRTGTGGNDRR